MPEVWKVDVEAERHRLDRYGALLARAEAERASRFRRSDDRLRFLVARGTLREILADRLGCAPDAIEFDTGPNGKPALSNRTVGGPQFNSSHSGRWVLHAFDDLPVGVDIEEIRPEMAILEDYARVLSPEERRLVSRAAPADRSAALARVWVRKEAYVKALGEGLSGSLPDIAIDEAPDGTPTLVRSGNRPLDPRAWSLVDLDVDPAYRACLAHVRHRGPTVLREYGSTCSRTLG